MKIKNTGFSKLTVFIFVLFFSKMFSSCSSKDFQSQIEKSEQTQNGNSITEPNTPHDPTDPEKVAVVLKSRVEDTKNQTGFGGALALDFNSETAQLILMIPLPNGFLFSFSGAIPNYPDITYGPIFDANGKMKLAVRLPIKYFLKDMGINNPQRLPNGDPLPMMPASYFELPSLGLQFPQTKTRLNLYLGAKTLGLYTELPLDSALKIPVNISLPLKNLETKKSLGYLTYVVTKNGFPPGLFLSVNMPDEINKLLESYLN